MHLQKLDASEKRSIRKATFDAPESYLVALWNSCENQHSIISESGLYKVITRADGLLAKPFQDWVTQEVIPSIRKTGGYLLNEDMRETAAADSREEFPLPASFSDALRKLADEVERE